MPLILHGSAASACYQRVLIVAAELGLNVDCIEVNMMVGEHKQPAYLEHQPFGLVPWFEDTDSGIEIFESRAICRYLVVKHGADHLMPLPTTRDYLPKLAQFETAASIEYSTFSPIGAQLVAEGLFKKALGGGEKDPALMKKLTDQLSSKLDGYERILSKQTYLAGQQMTLADLFHYPTGRYIFKAGLGNLIESRPNVARWWKSVTERESCVKIWNDLGIDSIVDPLASM